MGEGCSEGHERGQRPGGVWHGVGLEVRGWEIMIQVAQNATMPACPRPIMRRITREMRHPALTAAGHSGDVPPDQKTRKMVWREISERYFSLAGNL